MKTVLYTQRVEVVKSYGERRDCADQNIARFLSTCGFLPLPGSKYKGTGRKNDDGIKTGGNCVYRWKQSCQIWRGCTRER